MSASDLVLAVRKMVGSQPMALRATFGELSTYDPTLHQGKFLLPMMIDPTTGKPIETGYMPIGTLFTGVGYGAQFNPPTGAQALVIFIDAAGIFPVCACLTYNSVETPPFKDGKSRGWLDAKGNAVKTTDDGPTPGDGVGGARVVGSHYASVTAATLTEIGAEGLAAGKAAVTKDDLQAAINALKTNVQTAIDALADECSGGPGVAHQSISAVTATGSAKVRVSD